MAGLKSEKCDETTDGTSANDENSENAKNSKVTLIFHDIIENRINYRISSKEEYDIISSIDFLVQTLIATVVTKVTWLPFSRLVMVGSMAEGTSIMDPDEFDYLVVLRAEADGIEIERVCQERRGYVHVKVTDPHLRYQWEKWLDGKYLKSNFTRADTNNTLGNAFKSEVEAIIREKFHELTCTTETGTMKVDSKSMKKHGPAFMLKFAWTPFSGKEKRKINVDITTAFEMNLSPEVISVDDTYDASFFTKVKEHGKCMIVSCHNNSTCKAGECFLLTFTETEVELVRNLSQHHKKCYKLSKYIFNSGVSYSFLPSYVLKTLILKHSCHCQETENLAVCFKRLVASCLHHLFTRATCEKMELSKLLRLFLPGENFALNISSIFYKEHSILDSKDYKIPCELFLQEIEIMLQSIEDISCEENTDVDDQNLKIVNNPANCWKAYAKSLALSIFHFKRKLKLTNCLKCCQSYLNEDTL